MMGHDDHAADNREPHMTDAQERAISLYMKLPLSGAPDMASINLIASALARVEAETRRVYRELIARNLGLDHNLRFQRSFTKREIINALDEVEIVMDGQQAQQAKEGACQQQKT